AVTAGGFAATCWTLVLAARGTTPEARAALSDLCATYYEPVVRFLRREGRDPDDARELAQAFFARVLAGRGFAAADPARGRFRSYLLGALRHFLGDRRDHRQAARRGGGIAAESLAGTDDEGPGLQVAADTADDALAFDREWALDLMRRALEQVEAEYASDGRGPLFTALKPWLGGDVPTGAGESGTRGSLPGLSAGAWKVAVHRLRRRFREIIRAEVADTVPDPADIDAELRHLVEVLARATGSDPNPSPGPFRAAPAARISGGEARRGSPAGAHARQPKEGS
ncbi:MAG: RNA polymerase sigma factor, partial [Verrucomicrobiota bacterium]